MKIGFAGGGTGGHFYPIIAVAEEVNKVVDEQKIIDCSLIYISTDEYDKAALLENGLKFEKIYAGKLRVYFSLKNFLDIWKTFFGVINAIFVLYRIYPDVIFSKGAYASFPTLFAARLLGIPVLMHESDCSPGRVNKWTGKFAKKIAVSFAEASTFFPSNKVALTGQPVRTELREKSVSGMYEYFGLDSTLPVLWVVGGSQGSQVLNDVILEILPNALKKYQIIHVCGDKNVDSVKEQAKIVLGNEKELLSRYKVFGFLNSLGIKMAAGASSLCITRGGSMLFELALWGLPAIVVPIEKSNGDHQRKNAFSFAKKGGAVVVEEANLDATILESEIDRILGNKDILDKMKESMYSSATPQAARLIAEELVKIAQSHEK